MNTIPWFLNETVEINCAPVETNNNLNANFYVKFFARSLIG